LKNPPEPEALFADWKKQFERVLDACLLTTGDAPERLQQAMRYSALSGGKRIRPMLVYAAGLATGVDTGSLHHVACAVELIHAYSLIHDDLPAMDDDDLRRGKPTCHLAYDEATAILAGDALQALAFHVLATKRTNSPDAALQLIGELSAACGSQGMAGGQMLDLEATGQATQIEALERIHRLKTGALIRFSVIAPALIGGSDADDFDALDRYGNCVGLGFQIRDDILDVTGDSASLGKHTHADAERNKPTFPSLLGLAAAETRAMTLKEEALSCLQQISGDTHALAWLAEEMIIRDR